MNSREEMQSAMTALRLRLRRASEKDTGVRLNNRETMWVEEMLNNGIGTDELEQGNWDV